ncbi:MAG TPA: hypothetical protein DCE77_03445 [Methylophaga sp.]|nr:hypothetical protein [Methylophaga sp.]HBX59363.1 hypothetical protein [Methylophaga sp.]HCO01499.1 hypothetical protein [Methylophaga sp.]
MTSYGCFFIVNKHARINNLVHILKSTIIGHDAIIGHGVINCIGEYVFIRK